MSILTFFLMPIKIELSHCYVVDGLYFLSRNEMIKLNKDRLNIIIINKIA